MGAGRKTIDIPPELTARAVKVDEHGRRVNLTAVLARHYRKRLEQVLAARRARPRPLTLQQLFERQGEVLITELADGVTHYELFLRWTSGLNPPVTCSYGHFCKALAEFRRCKGLPQRRRRRAEHTMTSPE